MSAAAGPEYGRLSAAELTRDSSSPHDLGPTTVTVQQINRDPFRAFIKGTFLEEGYFHVAPAPLPPTPFDGTWRCVYALLTAPMLLNVCLIVLAHSGWWSVVIDDSNETINVGDTANFRAVARFMAGTIPLLAWCLKQAEFIYTELRISSAHRMHQGERLARFGQFSYEIRATHLLAACCLAYPAVCPPSVGRTFVETGLRLFFAGAAVLFSVIGALQRYSQIHMMMVGPHVRDKTSLRAQCARTGRDTLIYYLVCLVVLVHTAYYFMFEADVIPIRSCDDPLWAGADCGDYASQSDDGHADDVNVIGLTEGRWQCELNLGAIPLVGPPIFLAGVYDQLMASGLSITSVLSRMQLHSVPVGSAVYAAVVTLSNIINMVAMIDKWDDKDVCEVVSYLSWGLLAPAIGVALIMPLPVLIFSLEQHCSSRFLRKMNCASRAFIQRMSENAETAAAAAGVREARWELKGEFAAFVSHYKAEAAGDARQMKDRLSKLLEAPVFLDSDDLIDLRELLRIVARSDVFVLLQTSNVLARPWCLLETYTAILNHVPIVAINVEGSFAYSYQETAELLDSTKEEQSFADRLASINPGAVETIRKQQVPVQGVFHDVNIEELGQALERHLPNLISCKFTPAASETIIGAQLEVIVGTMERVKDSLAMEAARGELRGLKFSALEKRARQTVGVSDEALEEALDAEDQKEGLIDLVLSA